MMWLEKALARRNPTISPIENNPVGWSSIYAPEVLTNSSPDVSPLAKAMMMTPEQKIGRLWNLATGQAKPAYTNADLPQLSAAGNDALDAGMGWATTTPIRAFHGSPHTFDRFDLSKIGTGEGAQAYGHGLYFAGNEKVARGYRDTLTPPGMRVIAPDGGAVIAAPGSRQFYEPLVAALKDVPGESYIKTALARAYSEGAPDLTAATIKNAFGDMALSANDMARATQAINKLVADAKPILSSFKIERPGSMYEVSLRTSPERLLDWDKPLHQQPEAVRKAVEEVLPTPSWGQNLDMTGAEVWRRASEMNAPGWNNSREAGAAALRELGGLDGIQYLDAGSRAAGEGSRNYVMFRDDIIDILRRYGLFGLGMTGGAMGAAQQYAPQGAEQ